MVMFNMKVDLEQFCETFQCQSKVARDCFAHLGLFNPEFEEKYDLMFGEGEFERRNSTHATHKRRYASMSQDE